MRNATRHEAGSNPAELLPLEEIERLHVLKILRACNGSRKDAAKLLKIDRKTLARKLSRWSVSED